jgi:hypothetical protein
LPVDRLDMIHLLSSCIAALTLRNVIGVADRCANWTIRRKG